MVVDRPEISSPVIEIPKYRPKKQNTDSWLWDGISNEADLSTLVRDWIKSLQENEEKASLEMINFVLLMSGCSLKINQSQFEDEDCVTDVLEEMQQHAPDINSYLMGQRTQESKLKTKRFFKFFSFLVVELRNLNVLDRILTWIVSMSSCPARSFRHTSTALAMHLCSCLCAIKTQQAKELVESLYDGVLLNRYRDYVPLIRKECLLYLGLMVQHAPETYLDSQHLRYFGWMLHDQDAGVRSTSLRCLVKIYISKNTKQLELFQQRFKMRILQMAQKDKDSKVRGYATQLLCSMYPLGLLFDSELTLFVFAELCFSNQQVTKVLEMELKDYTWPMLAEFLVTVISKIYPADKHCRAIDHFVSNVPKLFEKDLINLILEHEKNEFDSEDLSYCRILKALSKKQEFAEQLMSVLLQLLLKYASEYLHLECFCFIVQNCKESWIKSSHFSDSLIRILELINEYFVKTLSDEFEQSVCEMYYELNQIPSLEAIVSPKLNEFLSICQQTLNSCPSKVRYALRKFNVHLDCDFKESNEDFEIRFLMELWAKQPNPKFVFDLNLKLREPNSFLASLLLEHCCVFQETLENEYLIEQSLSLDLKLANQIIKTSKLKLCSLQLGACLLGFYSKSKDLDETLELLIPMIAQGNDLNPLLLKILVSSLRQNNLKNTMEIMLRILKQRKKTSLDAALFANKLCNLILCPDDSTLSVSIDNQLSDVEKTKDFLSLTLEVSKLITKNDAKQLLELFPNGKSQIASLQPIADVLMKKQGKVQPKGDKKPKKERKEIQSDPIQSIDDFDSSATVRPIRKSSRLSKRSLESDDFTASPKTKRRKLK